MDNRKVFFDENTAKCENFSLYSFDKESFNFVKPIYVGFCILEFSKLLLYEW